MFPLLLARTRRYRTSSRVASNGRHHGGHVTSLYGIENNTTENAFNYTQNADEITTMAYIYILNWKRIPTYQLTWAQINNGRVVLPVENVTACYTSLTK